MNPQISPVQAPVAPSPLTPASLPLQAWIAALLLALTALTLYTWNAKFPYFDHVDEPGKVHQVQTLELNFHHPLLLLNSTYAALSLTGGSFQNQPVVEMGRRVSAVAAAISVAALTLLAWRIGGSAAGLLAGVTTLSHPMLFELAHYMKEDCVLLAGITVTFALLNRYNEAPSVKIATLGGLAAGLATAGKYVGAFMLAVGLFTILCTPWAAKGKRNAALCFILAALGLFALINLQILLDFKTATWGLGTEFEKIQAAADDHPSLFQHKYFTCMTSYLAAPLLAGAFFWGARRWQERSTQRLFTWVLLAFPILLLLGMSFSPKIKDRYVLPVAIILGVLGSMGLVEMARTARFSHAAAVTRILILAAIAWPLPSLWRKNEGFRHDDRQALILWIREHLPADAHIACDGRARLEYPKSEPGTDLWFPQEILVAEKSIADLRTLDELRAQGVHYAVAVEQVYGEFLRPLKGRKPNQARAPREVFYKQLFSTGHLLWESPRGQISYLHPGLRLYEF